MRTCKQSAALLSVCMRSFGCSHRCGAQPHIRNRIVQRWMLPKLGMCGVTDGGVDTMSTLRQLVSADMEQCVHMQMWNSVCTCRSGTVCVHADLEQCVHMQMWNSVCTCRSGTVCAHADVEQCVHMQMWNSVCTCRCGTVCAHADLEQCVHMQWRWPAQWCCPA
jgi:hypothetical protein